MKIRLAYKEDIPRIVDIYESARKRMRANGNESQWVNYPNEQTALEDLERNCLYVMEENVILGVFSFVIGEDPTYRQIDGKWLNDEPYGTVHRLASSGERGGIFAECCRFCFSKIANLRMDTHKDNRIMLNLLKQNGFVRCGIISCRDGTPRIAFQKKNELE